MRPLALLAVLSLIACGGKDDTVDGATDVDTDTDTDTDADTDSDTDTDTDTDADTDTDTDADTDTDPDTDGDGLSDAEEATHGSNPNDEDSDDDGLLDGAEVNEHDSDPTDEDTDDDGLLDGAEVDTHGTEPDDEDTDGDGLGDGDEVTDGTSPILADTDGDGLDDGREPLYNTDPTDEDTDDDGLLDGAEIGSGTSPSNPDTDGDGLSDGDEVNVYASNPLVTDTDGDTIPDGLEVDRFYTSPTNPDSDGDTLGDADELRDGTSPTRADTDGDGLRDDDEALHGTDPNDPDTDADGLEDGDEVLLGADPLVQDTDGDRLLDGEEVNQWSTDPTLEDTDGDRIDDGIEALDLNLDPADADTDDGGTEDGQELLDRTNPRDRTDDLTPPGCTFPDLDVANPAWVPPGPAFHPIWAEVEWSLAADAAGAHDYAEGGVDRSSTLQISLYGPEREPQCSVTFDLSLATRVPPTAWAPTSGQVHDAWELDPVDGITDCARLDPLIYGDDDIRVVLARVPWGVGLGSLGDLGPELEASVRAAGGDWANDWAPFVNGGFVTFDRLVAHPFDYTFVDAMTCEEVDDDGSGNPVPLPATTPASVPDGLQVGAAFDTFGADELMPECDRSEYAMPAGRVGGAPNITPHHFYVFVNVTPAPDGTIGDMDWDSDLDGVLETWTSYIALDIRDAANVSLCAIFYDASVARPLATDQVVSYSGELWQLWEHDLANGNSNCNDVSPLQFGSRDLRDFFVNSGFVFGVGELQDILTLPQAPQDPGTYGLYAGFGGPGTTVYEMDSVVPYDIDDCYVRDRANRAHPVSIVEGGGIVNSETPFGYYVFNF